MVAPLPAATPLRSGRPAFRAIATGAAVAGVLVAGASSDDGVVLCPFRRCTGGYCPGCGATRAANRLAHGDLQASWSQHPWVILAVAQLIVLGVVVAGLVPTTRRLPLRRLAIPLVAANTVLLIAIWVGRISTGSVPTGWL